MKAKFIALAFTVAIASSWYVIAATDYARIKKDTGVMSQIVKGALKADRDCKRCSVRVDGKYLAGQGVLFLVNSSASSYSWAYSDRSDHSDHSDHSGHDFSFSFDDDDFEGFEYVTDILEGVLPAIPAITTQVVKIVDDSTRIALREIRREHRDL